MRKFIYLIFIIIVSIAISGCITTGANISSGGSYGISIGGSI
ncbi:hypothetical protein [Aliarcobacter cibarius]|nr:hypothetical protein [Aliarcobacter cibarius]